MDVVNSSANHASLIGLLKIQMLNVQIDAQSITLHLYSVRLFRGFTAI
jgi:hypothetical protein